MDQPQFTGLSVGGKFSVFELDENENPIMDSGTSYQPQKVLHTRLLIKKIKQRIRSKRMEHQKL